MIGNFIKSFRLNKVVRNFVLADLVLFGGWGLVSPIMAIFIIGEIPGATLVTVGSMAAVYWAVRSSIELPMATLVEKTDSEKDDLYVLILGLLLVSASAFWLNFVETIPQLFTFQAVHALGFAFYAASWSGIFSRHVDKKRVAISWAIDHTVLGIATGVTGLFGAYIAEMFGFRAIFIIAGIASLIAAILIFLVPDIILPGKKNNDAHPIDHSPKTTSK